MSTRPLLLAALLLAAAAPLQAQEGAAGPSPAVAGAPAETPAPRAARRSWTATSRDLAVGDVITVLVDEYTLASANKDNTAVDRKRRDAQLKVGMPDGASEMAPRFGTRNDGESVQHGATARQNRFRSEIAVRVVELGPNGMARVEGTKLVDVDRNQQQVTFSGWVRPADVSAVNQVESWKVADASLVYSAKGNLGKPRGGIVGRMVGWIWP